MRAHAISSALRDTLRASLCRLRELQLIVARSSSMREKCR
jgi:hypothetical protein